MAVVLGAMGEHMQRFLDVATVYPNKAKSFRSFLCGNIDENRGRLKSILINAGCLFLLFLLYQLSDSFFNFRMLLSHEGIMAGKKQFRRRDL